MIVAPLLFEPPSFPPSLIFFIEWRVSVLCCEQSLILFLASGDKFLFKSHGVPTEFCCYADFTGTFVLIERSRRVLNFVTPIPLAPFAAVPAVAQTFVSPTWV